MGGCRDPSCAVSKRGEEHAAGCGLLVTSVLHNFTARLPQVPELGTHNRKTVCLYRNTFQRSTARLSRSCFIRWPTWSRTPSVSSYKEAQRILYCLVFLCWTTVIMTLLTGWFILWTCVQATSLTLSPWPHSPGLQSRYCWIASSSHLETRHSGSGCTAWPGKCWWPATNGCPTPCTHSRWDSMQDGSR